MAKSSDKQRKSASSVPSPTIDLLSYYYLLREKWWVFAFCFAVALVVATAYVIFTRKIFTSTAVVQVEQQASNVTGIKEVTTEDYKSIEDIKTIEGALSSDSLMLRVLRVNKLDKESDEFQAPLGEPPLLDAQLIDIMQAKCDVKLRRSTRLIDISVDDPKPERARKLAQSVIEEYIKSAIEQKSKVAGLANEGLIQQATELKKKLEKSEQALQDYREKFGTVSLEEKQNILADKLKELNKQIQEAKSNRIKLESDLPMLQKASTLTAEELLSIESVAKAAEIIDIQKILSNKEGEFGQLKKRYLELHPKYIQAQNEIKQLHQSLAELARKVAVRMLNSVQSAKDTELKLTESLQELEKSGLELGRIAIPYSVLQREAQADRVLYDSILARVKETKVTEEIEKTNIRLVSEPVTAKWPSKPKKMRTLAAALAAAGIVGMLIIVFMQAFNTSLRSVDQAEEMLALPSLSAVPEAKGKARKTSLVLVHHPAGRESESFRCLRTALSLQPGGAPRSVLFTSAVPAEGKSYCSANYAVSLAQQGLRVLLIDADLRRPGLGLVFPKLKEANGLSEVLSGKVKFNEGCHDTEVERLMLMPAGTKIGNPAELLGSPKFLKTLEEALSKFDRVLLDTAPVNAVSDTLLLVEHVDAVTFVVRARKTPARALLRALHLLENANAPIAGFILNRLPSRLANYYYYDEGSYSSAGVYGT